MTEIILRDITPEEEAERKQFAKEVKTAEKAAKAKEAARQSALTKLAELGLTEKEIEAITGA